MRVAVVIPPLHPRARVCGALTQILRSRVAGRAAGWVTRGRPGAGGDARGADSAPAKLPRDLKVGGARGGQFGGRAQEPRCRPARAAAPGRPLHWGPRRPRSCRCCSCSPAARAPAEVRRPRPGLRAASALSALPSSPFSWLLGLTSHAASRVLALDDRVAGLQRARDSGRDF